MPVTDKVFIVVGEYGEYSNRNDWVAGVFTNEEQAKQAIAEKDQQRREAQVAFDNYWDRKYKEFPGGPGMDYESQAEIEAKIGPYPPEPEADRFYLVPCPIDQWGKYPISGE